MKMMKTMFCWAVPPQQLRPNCCCGSCSWNQTPAAVYNPGPNRHDATHTMTPGRPSPSPLQCFDALSSRPQLVWTTLSIVLKLSNSSGHEHTGRFKLTKVSSRSSVGARVKCPGLPGAPRCWNTIKRVTFQINPPSLAADVLLAQTRQEIQLIAGAPTICVQRLLKAAMAEGQSTLEETRNPQRGLTNCPQKLSQRQRPHNTFLL